MHSGLKMDNGMQICRGSAGDMQHICSRYAADMQQIFSRYAADMQQICDRYAADSSRIPDEEEEILEFQEVLDKSICLKMLILSFEQC